MDFPEQIKQHKAESDSYAILLYKLKDVGIFRNMTENDYGIDFEIEFVEDGKVVGNYIKAQVKSSENLTIRTSDSVPTISGIKQSTLNYWAELSYKSHVIAYAVDLKNENIYISKPLFWQAIALLDSGNSTKTIEFIPHQIDQNTQDSVAPLFTRIFGRVPQLLDEIYNHKIALKNLDRFFSLYADVHHYDIGGEVNAFDDFATFLDVCRVLLFNKQISVPELSDDENKYIFSYDYWKRESGDGEVINCFARKPLKVLLPLLLDKLKIISDKVIDSEYYWRHKNRTYLKLVTETRIPSCRDHDSLCDLGY